MKNTLILLTIFVFVFTASASAETSIKAEVDKTNLTTDETLAYKIIITSTEKKLSTPQVSKFEGFNILSSAQSSTMSFLKNNIKTILVYAFILAPADTGKFKIGPATLKIKNETLSTDTFEIEVKQGKAQPKREESPSQEPQFTL